MVAKEIQDRTSLAEVLNLLRESALPHDDIKLNHNLFFAYNDATGALLGSGGLELFADYALMRSIAVVKQHRGQELGKQIVTNLISLARQRGIKKVFLLTETAHDFFIKLGFKDVARENVPDQVKSSSEFTSVCPVSAACMEIEVRELVNLAIG